MSLLLDALRKSEQQRRLGETPRIQLSNTAPLETRRKKLPTLLIGLVVVAGLLLVWLFLLQRSADQLEAPAVVQAIPESSESTSETPSQNNAGQNQSPAQGSPIQRAQAASEPVIEDADETAGEQLLSALNDENAERALDDFDQLAEQIAAQQEQANQQALIKQQAEKNEVDVESLAVAEPAVSNRAPVDTSEQQETPVVEVEWQPEKPDYINYFDLPAGVRQKLPELPITIRVFDAIPSKRFVVINRQRLQEGDFVGDSEEVRLIEIKRDSLVLEYQGYIFEYE